MLRKALSPCQTFAEHCRMWENRDAHTHTCRQKYLSNFTLVMFHAFGRSSLFSSLPQPPDQKLWFQTENICSNIAFSFDPLGFTFQTFTFAEQELCFYHVLSEKAKERLALMPPLLATLSSREIKIYIIYIKIIFWAENKYMLWTKTGVLYHVYNNH